MDTNTLKTNNKKELQKVLESHEQTIIGLTEFIKGKMNVHGEIRKYVASLGTSYRKIIGEMKKQDPPTSIVEVQTSPSLLRTFSETTAKDTEGEEDNKTITPKNRTVRKVKRKERTSPEETIREVKIRRKEAAPLAADQRKKPESEWTEVKKKPIKKTKKIENRGKAGALIIRPKEKEQYADILKRVKQNPSADQISQCVDKIRRTTSGDVLLILTKKDTDKALELRSTISNLLGQDAAVMNLTSEEDLEIKDLEDTTTKQEILEAMQKVVGEADEVGIDAIKTLRKAYGGTVTASLRVNSKVAMKVLEHGNIRVLQA